MAHPTQTVSRSLESLVEYDWFLGEISGHVALREWRIICCVSRRSHAAVTDFISLWPASVQEHYQKWPGCASSVLVFGCHHSHPLESTLGSLRINPSPIVSLSFDNICFDSQKEELFADSWRELVSANDPPTNMGRMLPGVCLVEFRGNAGIFYCGGSKAARHENDPIDNSDLDSRVSDVTAVFDLTTLSWHRMPDMPEGRENASVCTSGSKVFVFNGEIDFFGRASQSVLCFDLTEERWLRQEEHGIPSFPGAAYGGCAIGSSPCGSVVLLASGKYEYEYHPELGPLIESSREVYSLSLTSLEWSRKPDLPANVSIGSSDGSTNGAMWRVAKDDENKYRFAMSDGENFLTIDEDSDSWEVLPSPCPQDTIRPWPSCSIVQGWSLTVALVPGGARIYSESEMVWTSLRAQTACQDELFLKSWDVLVKRPNGTSFKVMFTGQETAVAVSSACQSV